jgi:hypothetical protein
MSLHSAQADREGPRWDGLARPLRRRVLGDPLLYPGSERVNQIYESLSRFVLSNESLGRSTRLGKRKAAFQVVVEVWIVGQVSAMQMHDVQTNRDRFE